MCTCSAYAMFYLFLADILGVNSLRTCRIQPCNSSYRLSGHPFEKVSSWTTYMSPKTAPKYMNELRMRYHGLFHQKCNKFGHSFSNPWHVHRKNLDIQQERERKIGYWTIYSSGKPWPIHANEIRKSFLQVGYMWQQQYWDFSISMLSGAPGAPNVPSGAISYSQ